MRVGYSHFLFLSLPFLFISPPASSSPQRSVLSCSLLLSTCQWSWCGTTVAHPACRNANPIQIRVRDHRPLPSEVMMPSLSAQTVSISGGDVPLAWASRLADETSSQWISQPPNPWEFSMSEHVETDEHQRTRLSGTAAIQPSSYLRGSGPTVGHPTTTQSRKGADDTPSHHETQFLTGAHSGLQISL
jgi:hypothetical protein